MVKSHWIGGYVMEQKLRRDCDIGRTTYAKYESGELNVRISVLDELKDIYNCTYDELLRIL